jgi:hypothetical protein
MGQGSSLSEEHMTQVDTLGWDEIKPDAPKAFSIWGSGSDFEWAKEAWTLLMKSGACSYNSERERHIVIGRFLALASIYRDWCSIVFDEMQEDEPLYWVEDLDVRPIFIGQALADEPLFDDDLSDALSILLQQQRPVVVDALLRAYGSDSGLFVSLWRSVRSSMSPEPGDEDYEEETDAQILNDPAAEKVAGHMWISEGCPHSRPI